MFLGVVVITMASSLACFGDPVRLAEKAWLKVLFADLL